jgi:hypothetical protein
MTQPIHDTGGAQAPEVHHPAPGSEVWVRFACAALVGEMASISLHDQPHLWRPKQAEHSAEMADAMMAEYRKRWRGPKASAILADMVEDPHDNGDYRLSCSGMSLAMLWEAIETQEADLRKERKRLDWLERHGATPICSRAAIDAAMASDPQNTEVRQPPVENQ